MRRVVAVLATVLGASALVSGCSTGRSASATPSTAPQIVEVTITGSTVSPNGTRVDVPLGTRVELVVHADADGTIHVHASPEQKIDYHAGTTQASLGAFTVPGQVSIESHALNRTIVILVVR